jgi:hypothetical protein
VEFHVEAQVFEWRGPAPFFFCATGVELASEIRETARELSYGWGMIPCHIELNENSYKTSLTPKDGVYYIPLRDQVRRENDLKANSVARLTILLGL